MFEGISIIETEGIEVAAFPGDGQVSRGAVEIGEIEFFVRVPGLAGIATQGHGKHLGQEVGALGPERGVVLVGKDGPDARLLQLAFEGGGFDEGGPQVG